MGVYLEIVFTVLGGLIAGIVGLSSTYVSLRAHRREKHLDEHKENLKLLKRALINGKNKLWPFIRGDENISLAKEYQIDYDEFKTGIDVILNLLVMESEYNALYRVDIILYQDIKNHFFKLWNKLAETDRDIKERANIIYENINKISKSIYDKLNRNETNIAALFPDQVPKSIDETGKETIKLKFKDASNYFQENVAGDVFLFAIQEDEKAWPNKLDNLKQIGLYNILKGIGDTVQSEVRPEIKEMLKLRNKLFVDIDNCVQEIEIILHQTKLKGRCKLA